MKTILLEFPHATIRYGDNNEKTCYVDFMVERYTDESLDKITAQVLRTKIMTNFAKEWKIYFPHKVGYLCYDFTEGRLLPKIFNKNDLNASTDAILPFFWVEFVKHENFFDYIEYTLSKI